MSVILDNLRQKVSLAISRTRLRNTSRLRDPFLVPIFLRESFYEKNDREKGLFIVTFDVETANDLVHSRKSVEEEVIRAQENRFGIRYILDMSERFNFPFTWFCTGHALLKGCEGHDMDVFDWANEKNGFNGFWSSRDWFCLDPCSDYTKDPAWYFGDLVENILDSGVDQEIGCHTFSHLRCDLASRDTFSRDLDLFWDACRNLNTKVVSFAFPWDSVGHIDLLEKRGFDFVRVKNTRKICAPKRMGDILLFHESLSGHVSPWLMKLGLDIAVRQRSIFVWLLHPWEIYLDFGRRIFVDVLNYAKKLVSQGSLEIKTLKNAV